MRRWSLPPRCWTVTGLTLALDWGTKWCVAAFLVPTHPVPVFSQVAQLTLEYDARTSLELGVAGTPAYPFPGGLAALSLMRLGLLVAIAWIASRAPRASQGYAVGFGLLLGSCVGNGLEDLCFGRVVNFVDLGVGLHRWPTFNVADVAALAGTVLVGGMMMREHVHERGWRGALRSLCVLPTSFRRLPGQSHSQE